MTEPVSTADLILHIKERFHNTSDLFVEILEWRDASAIVCYYTVLTEGAQLNEQIEILRKRAEDGIPDWGETGASTILPFSMSEMTEAVTTGSVAVIFPNTNKLLKITIPKVTVRSPSEPENEHVIRGSHEGFVESFDANIALIRKRLPVPNLVVQSLRLGGNSNTLVSYMYIDSLADKDIIADVKKKLEGIETTGVISSGQIEDSLEGSVWSPFPQLLNTERPDRVAANLLEGKIAIFTDQDPTALIGPITFFSFYQSPDDFNGRVLVGSFLSSVLPVNSFSLNNAIPATSGTPLSFSILIYASARSIAGS